MNFDVYLDEMSDKTAELSLNSFFFAFSIITNSMSNTYTGLD